MNVQTAFQQAKYALPFFEARALLCRVLEVSPAVLVAHPGRELNSEEQEALNEFIERRRRGMPLAYLTGKREFFGLEFVVSPAVLIPRPETESLIEIALEKVQRRGRILDLGTGCGNVAISIALARPRVQVIGVDVSAGALAVARENANQLGASNLRWLQSDWFTGLANKVFDVIVANPPYVAEHDPHLEQGDLRFEPKLALLGGVDGLGSIRKIVEAPKHLAKDGWLIFEHGYDQAEACRKLLEENEFAGVFSADDLAGIPRVSGGQWRFSRRGATV
ncbi:MAG: peptide chain release factor N(5)-glutamine methyltransferase [Burkholderiales bacterium]